MRTTVSENERNVFRRNLIHTVIPIAFQQFMLALVSASDAVMLGALQQDYLSAVSLAVQIQFMFSLFMTAITIGTSMLAAQYWGRGDITACEKIMAISLRIAVIVSLPFVMLSIICPQLLMRIFTDNPILIDYGVRYLRTASLVYFLTAVSQVYLCILKNSGHTAKASVISSVTVILNIGLNAVLIFGIGKLQGMQIAGAALATVIAKTFETGWALAESVKPNRLKLRWAYFTHTDRLLQRDFWKYTWPVMGNEIVWGVGFTMYSVIMGHLGSDAVAANSIANIAKNLIGCFCGGLANGGSILLGNELGRGNLELGKKYGKWLCHAAILCGILAGTVFLFVTPIVLHFSSLSDTANGYLKWMLYLCVYYMIGRAVSSTTIAGIFCAGGDSRFGLKCDAVTMWCVIVPLGFLAAFVWDIPVIGVYFIINLDELIKMPAIFIHYRKYNWVKNLTRETK